MELAARFPGLGRETAMALTDGQWAVLEPLIGAARPRGKVRPRDLRRTIEAIVWRHRNGATWGSLPAEYGPLGSRQAAPALRDGGSALPIMVACRPAGDPVVPGWPARRRGQWHRQVARHRGSIGCRPIAVCGCPDGDRQVSP